MIVLLTVGKYVEKKYGSVRYAVFFHCAAIIDAVIIAFTFKSESVGASAGVFAIVKNTDVKMYTSDGKSISLEAGV